MQIRSLSSPVVLVVVLMLFAPFEIVAKNNVNIDPVAYENKLKEGIEAFYQTNWGKATTIFEELRQTNKEDPRAYFFLAMIPFWEYFFGGFAPDAAEAFLMHSQQAIEVSNKQLEADPHDTTMVLMLSGLHGYRSLVAAKEQYYQTALQSGSTGYKYTRQLLSLDDVNPNALIGKGIFHYMTGNVPASLRWMTNMMGISGNKEEGFAYLEQAARSDSYVSNDARMILTYLYKQEERYGQALVHIKELCSRYRENVIFWFNYAQILEKSGREEEARQAYKTVIDMQNSYLPELAEQSRQRLEVL